MTLDEIIRERVEECLTKAVRFNTEATLTEDIWLRVIDREKAAVYSTIADGLLTALHDAEDAKRPVGVTSTGEPKGDEI